MQHGALDRAAGARQAGKGRPRLAASRQRDVRRRGPSVERLTAGFHRRADAAGPDRARAAVEPFTARLAAEHADAGTIEDLEGVLESAGATRDQDDFSKWDGEFHLLLAQASANPFLIHVFRQINHVRLNAQWGAMKANILMPEAIAEYNRQHRAVLDAIESRDPLLAQKRMAEHLESARNDLLKALNP
ncbi:FadR/GntR family transcriptional regulator [Methyloceanibacter stevinii]|uniref:FadR/GntR family transcriptional regulator n=1 Tax=Methyloceanibacter stevinii TaxID=1774970 RepID=UPI0009F53AC7|nr:FCD domain-containing protein [Methyloceanibacter stevinii]